MLRLVGDYGTSEHSETLIYGCYNVIMLYSNVTMEAADHIVEGCRHGGESIVTEAEIIPCHHASSFLHFYWLDFQPTCKFNPAKPSKTGFDSGRDRATAQQ